MKFPVFLVLFLTSTCFAGTVLFDTERITYDDEYSFKQAGCPDWSRRDFEKKVIYAITFNCGDPDTHVFPEDMTGVKFYNANLDNVFIPPGNEVINFNHAEPIKYKVMNDGEDWKVDSDTLVPVEPLAKEKFVELGISPFPADIPQTKQKEPITTKRAREKDAETEGIK